MGRFLGGVLLGVLLGGGGVWWWTHRGGDAVIATTTVDAGVAPGAPTPPGKKKRRAPRGQSGDTMLVAEGGGAEPVPLTAADLRMVAEGDALKPPAAAVDFTGDGEARTLSGDEINEGVRARKGAIEGCLVDARGADEVRARITVGAVVTGEGKVSQVRVEAPAILQRRGLAACLRKQFLAMRFPATGRATVLSVPFDLE